MIKKIAVLVLVLWASFRLRAEGLPDVFDSVARLRLETSQATVGSSTAWIYRVDEAAKKTYWVSCGHGVDNLIIKSHILIWNKSLPRVGSLLVKKEPLTDEDSDANILHDMSVITTNMEEGDKAIPLALCPPNVGDTLIVTCYERDYPARLFKVTLLSNKNGVLLVEPGFAPGMSGSPITSLKGEVVGVALWSTIFGPHQVFGKAVSAQILAPTLAEAIRK